MNDRPWVIEYEAKRILNIQKRTDGGWFWNKYSAHAYMGCQWGCHYCYCRDEKYHPHKYVNDDAIEELDDPFCQLIKVKTNAVELLRDELQGKERDIVYLGNHQAIDSRYGLARKMLKVCRNLNFPVLINEKSPLLIRDLDIMKQINESSYINVCWSIITARDDDKRTILENRAPPVSARFKAMKELSDNGLMTGIAFMPVLPYIYDTEENVREVVKKTAESGGKYVLEAGLTLDEYTRQHFYRALRDFDPALIRKYDELFNDRSLYHHRIRDLHLLVKKYCREYGLENHILRPVVHYPRYLRINKFASEMFHVKAREQVQMGVPGFREWAYRKAAWSLDELDEGIDVIYSEKGIEGLKSLDNIGDSISKQLVDFIENYGRRPR